MTARPEHLGSHRREHPMESSTLRSRLKDFPWLFNIRERHNHDFERQINLAQKYPKLDRPDREEFDKRYPLPLLQLPDDARVIVRGTTSLRLIIQDPSKYWEDEDNPIFQAGFSEDSDQYQIKVAAYGKAVNYDFWNGPLLISSQIPIGKSLAKMILSSGLITVNYPVVHGRTTKIPDGFWVPGPDIAIVFVENLFQAILPETHPSQGKVFDLPSRWQLVKAAVRIFDLNSDDQLYGNLLEDLQCWIC